MGKDELQTPGPVICQAAFRMSPLFSSRAGISVMGGGVSCSASWPLGKITLSAEALTMDTLLKSYRLRVTDIDCVRRALLSVEIKHHAPDVPGLVRVWGIGLFGRLRETIQRHQLRIEVSE
jgi:hypothetical protein